MSSVQTPLVAPKRSTISYRLIIIIGLVAFAIYMVVPRIMTQVMYLQEKAMADAKLLAYLEAKNKADNEFQKAMDEGSLSPPASGGPRAPAGFNAEEAFQRSDVDKSGMLEGAEITHRLQLQLFSLDKNEDGAISKEEFIEGMQSPEGAKATTPEK